MVKLFTSSATCWNTEKSTPWNSKSLESLWFPLSSLFPEGFSSPFRCRSACLRYPVFRVEGWIAPTYTFLLLDLDAVATSTANPGVCPRGYPRVRSLCAHLIEINKGGAVFPRGHSRSQLSIVSLMNSLQNEGSCTLIIRNTGRP